MDIHILVVEDDIKIARLLELELTHIGYDVTCAYNGVCALQKISNQQYDLVLLDIMMPKMDGIKTIKEIRRNNKDLPVIMLTAKGQIHDKVIGLDSGANDYMTKPFEMEELLARIRAFLRSSKRLDKEKFGDLTINYSTQKVSRKGIDIPLSEKEFLLLRYFIRNKNQILTREQILDGVWGYDFEGEFKIVDVYVGYLRKKLQVQQLVTVRGSGYMWREE
ncbi:MAG: response regulator transcription factor [Bacillaceae bacterium]